MNDAGNENLRELLAKFMNAEAAGRAAEDIERGEQLLRDWPAPQPGETVLAGIKKRMTVAAGHRRAITLRRRILTAVAAAVIFVVSASALKLLEKQPAKRTAVQYAAVIPERIWEGTDIAADDTDIAVLAAEVELIENDISGTRMDDNGVNGAGDFGDLEMELIETGGDFWKG